MSYEYRPLDAEQKEFRLLTVQGYSISTDPVRCTMSHASLRNAQKPRYEAISYVWGDQTKRSFIIVDGKVLGVPASAEYVLRRMRKEEEDRMLWIDAVCINQDDLEERNHQVALMVDVYSNTSLCLVWLGEAVCSGDRIVRAIQLVLGDARSVCANFRMFFECIGGLYDRQSSMQQWVYTKHGFSVPFSNDDFRSLELLFDCPWFERLWV